MPVLHRRLEAPPSDSLGRLFVQSHTSPANDVDEIDSAPLTDADEQVDSHFFLGLLLIGFRLSFGTQVRMCRTDRLRGGDGAANVSTVLQVEVFDRRGLRC